MELFTRLFRDLLVFVYHCFDRDNNRPVTQFLNGFIRGDRDLEDRRSDGSVLQALSLMNDPFITSRADLTKSPRNGLLNRYEQLLDNFYLAVLSRYPTD